MASFLLFSPLFWSPVVLDSLNGALLATMYRGVSTSLHKALKVMIFRVQLFSSGFTMFLFLQFDFWIDFFLDLSKLRIFHSGLNFNSWWMEIIDNLIWWSKRGFYFMKPNVKNRFLFSWKKISSTVFFFKFYYSY